MEIDEEPKNPGTGKDDEAAAGRLLDVRTKLS
jgi:hypothetical protein